jgi:membrane protease YdiL (CAAX protease family)
MVEEAVFRVVFFRLLEEHAGPLKALVVQALEHQANASRG